MRSSSIHAGMLVVLSLAALAACGGGAATADAGGAQADGPPPSGSFAVSWTLSDGGAAVTCDAVGATLVLFTFLPSDGSTGFVAPFDCSIGMGTTLPQPVGDYNVDIALKNSIGQVMATGPHILHQALVVGQTTTVAPVAFTVSRKGGLSVHIDVPGTVGPNCTAEPTGAGLTGIRLELHNGAGACVPTAFMVAAGAANGAQTIAAGCPGPISPCIENDQEVTASGIAPGSYQLAIDGFEHGSTTPGCYTSTQQVTISGGDVVTAVGTDRLPITTDFDAGCTPP